MAPATAPSTELRPIERDVLDHFKEGVGLRTIGLRTNLELSDVQEIVTDTCGGDRTRAASLVAAFDRRNPGHQPVKPDLAATVPSSPPRPAPPAPAAAAAKPTPVRRPRRASQPTEAAPAAPTVVPVDLAEITPADVPVTTVAGPAPTDPPAAADDPTAERPDDPAEAALVARHDDGLVWDRNDSEADDDQAEAEDPVPAELGAGDDPRPALTFREARAAGLLGAGVQVDTEPRCTHGGDCTVHPGAGGLHDFARIEAMEAEALLDGPTEALPAATSFEELMAAAQRAGAPELARLAGEVSTAVDDLHAAYARERHARQLRSEAAILRRELDTRVAQLRRLAAGEPMTEDALQA